VKRAKCEINFQEVAYIGDKVAKDGVKLDESKIEAILHFPSP